MTRERYAMLENLYDFDCATYSMTKYGHVFYREVYDDPSTVPFLLESLLQYRGRWVHFELLYQLTGATPWCDNDRGHYEFIHAGWLRWGREHGII